jgi:hypothetical protein
MHPEKFVLEHHNEFDAEDVGSKDATLTVTVLSGIKGRQES